MQEASSELGPPPTSDILEQHLKRVSYQTYIWKNALVADMNLPSPEENGWHVEEGKLLPTLMSKSPTTAAITELVTCSCSKSHCLKGCSCTRQQMACTEACACSGDDECNNVYKIQSSATQVESDHSNSDFESDEHDDYDL